METRAARETLQEPPRAPEPALSLGPLDVAAMPAAPEPGGAVAEVAPDAAATTPPPSVQVTGADEP